MAKKDDFDIDDVDLDNFDFDIPEFDGGDDTDENSRSPISRAVKGSIKGAKDEILNKNSLRSAVSLALPQGYGLAADTLENIGTDLGSLYDTVTGESPELVRKSKGFGRKAMSLMGNKVLPKKIADRLNNALEESDNQVTSSEQYAREQEESELAALAEIFKAKAGADEERAKADDADKVETKALEHARFKSNIQALTAINRSMARLVGYQDSITLKYQQKMLEINYRQFATMKKLTDIMAISTEKNAKILETIRHNTALPEAVKIRGSEMFGQLARQRMMGSGLNTISNFTQNYTKQAMGNLQGMVRGAIDPLVSGVSMTEGMDRAQLAGNAVGAQLAGAARDYASMAISPYLERNQKIAHAGEKLRGAFSGLPQKVNEFAQSQPDGQGSGWKSIMQTAFKTFLPQFSLDVRAGGDKLLDLDEPATFDKLTRRSLVEIIPGYLSEIVHWTKTLATGEEGERQVYNVVRGGFTSQSDQLKDIQRELLPRGEREALRTEVDSFMAMIGADGMNMKAQRALKRKLLDELANGRDLKPERLSNFDEYPSDDPEAVEEIVSLITDSFGLDIDGKRTDTSTAGLKRFNDIADQFHRMSSLIPALTDRTRVVGDLVGKDSLRKLGYIRRDGREDTVDINRYWSNILDDDSPIEPSQEPAEKEQSYAANLMRGITDRIGKPGGDGIDPAGSADRADQASGESKGGRSRARGLERYLGDKSTLITLIRESRDFHNETVELLKILSNCSCNGAEGPQGLAGRLQSGSSDTITRLKQYSSAMGSRSSELWNSGKDEFGKAKELGKDIWLQGDDHPMITEAKLKAKQYRDKAAGEILTRWEDIQGDITDLQGKTVLRYNDFIDSGYIADKKGKLLNWARDTNDRFKSSKAGEWTASGIATAQHHIGTLGNRVNDIVASDSLGVAADKTAQAMGDVGKAASTKLKTFRPRARRLMKFFSSDKTGADVSSELTGEAQSDMVTLMMRSVQLQYQTLKEVTQEKVRKGSFKDLFSRKKEEQPKNPEGDEKDDVKGLFAKGGLLAGLLSGVGGDGEGGGGGFLGDLFGWGGGKDSDGKKKKKTKKPKTRLGRLAAGAKGLGGKALDRMGVLGTGLRLGGKAVGGVAKLGWGATKLLGKGAMGTAKIGGKLMFNPVTRMVAGTALRMTAGAALGALGLVSAPVLAAAGVAAAAVGVGAMVYSFVKSKVPPLTRLRLTQYGIKPEPDAEDVKALLALEAIVGKYTTVDPDGKAQVDMKNMPFEPIAQLFKINTDEQSEESNNLFQRVRSFIQGRFAAVYLRWVGEYHKATKSIDLTKVDDKMKGRAALEFLDKVSMSDRNDAMNAMVSPFKDPKLEADANEVARELKAVEREIRKAANKEAVDTAHKDPSLTAASSAGQIGAVVAKAAAEANKELDGAPTALGKAGAAAGTAAVLNVGKKTTTSNMAASVGLGGALAATAAPGIMASTAKALTARGKGLDDGKPVRYRAYGLTEMDEAKVAQLSDLENYCFAMTRYDKDGQALLDYSEGAWMRAEKIFAPIGDEARAVQVWFFRRFRPVFLAYCTAVRDKANIDAKDAADKLSSEQMLQVLRETATARDNAGISVWDISESPWTGYLLNMDPESVKEPLYNLSLKVKSKTLSEPSGMQVGRKHDKDGNLISEDPTQSTAGVQAGQGNGQPGSAAGASATGSGKEEGGFFSSVKDSLKGFFGFGGKDTQKGGISPSGQPSYSGGNIYLPTGTPINHPGGGTGGNINDIPEPKGDGWEANKETLMAAANMVGVDPALAASVAGVESNFRPNALPYRNPKNPSAGVLSSAASYYQVIKSTWKELMGRYAEKYGIDPNTTQHDPRANALLGLEYIRENINQVKKVVPRGVTDTDVYLAHFLGPNGARRFLAAPPGDPAIRHVGANQASSNPAIFYNRDGSPRTVADVYKDFDEKLARHRKQDAGQVATLMKKGGGVQDVPEVQDGGGEESSGGDLVAVSLVKPSTDVPATNPVVEAPDTSDTDIRETATTRQTQAAVAPLAMAARSAEVRSGPQTQAAANTYGGADASLGRLISVNESQLEQLVALVSLVKGGAMKTPGLSAERADLMAGTQTTQSPQLNVSRAAPKGTVSVQRA